MSIERGTDPRTLRRRKPGEDAVVMVRRALERAEAGGPLFPGEEHENRTAVQALEERLARLKARGVEFGEIELSVYARQLLAGAEHATLVT